MRSNVVGAPRASDTEFLRSCGVRPTVLPLTDWQARMRDYCPPCEHSNRAVNALAWMVAGVLAGGVGYWLLRALWCLVGRWI